MLITYPPLEAFVLDLVLASLESPSGTRPWRAGASTKDGGERALRDELEALDVQRRRVGDAVLAGAYTRAEATAKVEEIETVQQRIREKLSTLAADNVRAEVRNATDARRLWDSTTDVTRKRRFIQSFIKEVEVSTSPGGPSRRT